MSRAKKAGRFLNCYVKEDVISRLDNYSKQTMIPKTAIVEKALSEFFDRNVLSADGGKTDGKVDKKVTDNE